MNNLLKEFKTGWQTTFEPKLDMVFKTFPNINFISAVRTHGVLRIKLEAPLDNAIQYIVDCVTHKIERESALTCESCGKQGKPKTDMLPEKMCLCWKCYALEVDAIMLANTQT